MKSQAGSAEDVTTILKPREVNMVTLTFVAGFFMVFYKDRLFIKTKSLDYASKMVEVLR